MSDELFPVPEQWAKRAYVDAEAYKRIYAESVDSNEAFWAAEARELDWIKPFTQVKDCSYAPDDVHIKWFYDGTLNVSANCVDRHLAGAPPIAPPSSGKATIPAESRTITYAELHREVCRFANVLKANGVKKGDRVTIYLPMIPEVAYAMLACARIGAVHSVIFAGFSPDSIAGRIHDSDSRIVITADEGLRAGKTVPLKVNIDLALTECPNVKRVIMVKRTGKHELTHHGRDVWYHEEAAKVSGRLPARRNGRRGSAVHPLHLGLDRQAQGRAAHDGRLSHLRRVHLQIRVRLSRGRHLLVRRRRGLGHRAQLYRVRAAGERRHRRDVRRRAELSHRVALLGGDRQAQGDHLLHLAHRHPFADPRRRGTGEEDQPQIVASVGLGRRTDQSRSLAVVSPRGRRRPLSHRRHVVADRNRRHPDFAPARRHRFETGLRHQAAVRHRACHRRRRAARCWRANAPAIW